MFDKLNIQKKFSLATFIIIVLFSFGIALWEAKEQRNQSLRRSKEKAMMAGKLVLEGLTTLMETDNMDYKKEFFKKILKLQEVEGVRIIRGTKVDLDFQEGAGSEQPQNEDEKNILKTGNYYEFIDTEKGIRRFHFAIPYLAENNCRARGCHVSVKNGEVLGGISMSISMEKLDQETNNFIIKILIGNFIMAIIIGLIVNAIFRRIVVPITIALDQMKESSDQIFSASEQVQRASQQLSDSASKQVSSIEETSAFLVKMSGIVSDNMVSANKSSSLSENVKAVSLNGNNAMAEMSGSMKEIMDSNEKIQELVKVIGDIGDKTAVIDEIVFQTKILSFNASVEAERAGEHGRGFSVVAQEVGNLAKMSGKAAAEISLIVKNSIKSAEKITAENKKKVENGNVLVQESTKLLKEITENAIMVSENARQILNASKDQADGIDNINGAMTQLDSVAQDNAATAEEVATAAEELTGQVHSLNQQVEDLTIIVFGTNNKN